MPFFNVDVVVFVNLFALSFNCFSVSVGFNSDCLAIGARGFVGGGAVVVLFSGFFGGAALGVGLLALSVV